MTNDLGLPARELYAAPAGGDAGPERLGGEALAVGASVRLRFGRAAACSFNFRVVLSDDTVSERRNVDICRNPRVVFGDPSQPMREAVLQNETDLFLREFYAVPAGAGGRGPDRLGAEMIGPGESSRLRLGRTRECRFDTVAVFSDGSEVARAAQDLCRSPRLLWGDPALPWREARVANRAGRAMQSLYAVPAGGAGWGPDRLAEPLAEGAAARLRLRQQACRFDLRAIYEDEAAEERHDVDLCAQVRGGVEVVFDGSRIPRPPERSFTLVNRHGADVEEVYVSPSTDGEWGPERVPGGIARGARQEISLATECAVDLRVIFPTGGAEERREIDICQTATVVLRPGWTIADELDAGEGAPAGPRPGSVRLRNGALLPIVELYLDAAGDAAAPRGPDRLGANVLGAGETLDVAPPEGAPCAARLTAVFRDGREVVRDAFDLCQGLEVPLP